MKLRDFKKEDAPIIASWLRSEEELYKWSADRFNKYPLSGDDINENYAPQLETGRFIPLTAVDDNGDIRGYPFRQWKDIHRRLYRHMLHAGYLRRTECHFQYDH